MHWPGWPLGFNIWFVCWDGVGECAHLAIDLDTDGGRELVSLLLTRVQLTEPQLDLVEIVQLGAHPDVSVAGNVGGLVRGQHELELGLLKPAAPCNAFVK